MSDTLRSWNDTPTRQAIVEFVERVTREGSPHYLARRASRGVRQRRHALVREADADRAGVHPRPVRRDGREGCVAARSTALEGCVRAGLRLAGSGDHQALPRRRQRREGVDGRHPARVRRDDGRGLCGGRGRLPARGEPSDARAELPRLRLPADDRAAALPEANGFTNYIASGGDRDFMRPVTEEIYGIPAERVIGSSNALRYQQDESGGRLVYLAEPDVFDDGRHKARADLESHRPAPDRGRRQLQRRHPDAALHRRAISPRRCVCCSSTTIPSASSTTRPAPSKSLERADDEGWTVVSIKNDWSAVFADIQR